MQQSAAAPCTATERQDNEVAVDQSLFATKTAADFKCDTRSATTRTNQLVALAARYKMPVMYEWSEFAAAGGLISYSTVRDDTSLQAGIYVGRILNGAKPADLPIIQSTRFELVINLRTAKHLVLRSCPRCSPAPTR